MDPIVVYKNTQKRGLLQRQEWEKKLQKSERGGKAEKGGEGRRKKKRKEESGKVIKAAKEQRRSKKNMEMKIDWLVYITFNKQKMQGKIKQTNK